MCLIGYQCSVACSIMYMERVARLTIERYILLVHGQQKHIFVLLVYLLADKVTLLLIYSSNITIRIKLYSTILELDTSRFDS